MGRHFSVRRAARSLAVIAAIASLGAALQGPAGTTAGAEASFARALVVVKTLVIDGLGTRTVDTDSARVPFGSRGLLIKRVPYAGPPLSFRLAVLAGAPQQTGLPITLSADVWAGDVNNPPPSTGISHREEATVVAPETSYLFEIDHDPRTDRRIVLSVTARPIGEDEVMPDLSLDESIPVQFLLEVTREVSGSAEPTEAHLLNSMVGRQVTYSSGVRIPAPPGGTDRIIGLSVTITAEKVQAGLVTVKVELTGSDYVDVAHTRIEPIGRTEVQTVAVGARVEVQVTVPAPDPSQAPPPPDLRPVTYRVAVVPMLG